MKTLLRSSRRLTSGPENALALKRQISYSLVSNTLLRWRVESANDAFTVLRIFVIFGGVKKTIVDQHTLTACANRSDRPMPRAGDIAVAQLKQPAGLRQHNRVGLDVALKFNVRETHFMQGAEPAEIQQILKSGECIFLGAFRRI